MIPVVIPAKGNVIQSPPDALEFENGHLKREFACWGSLTTQRSQEATRPPSDLGPAGGKRRIGIGLHSRKREPRLGLRPRFARAGICGDDNRVASASIDALVSPRAPHAASGITRFTARTIAAGLSRPDSWSSGASARWRCARCRDAAPGPHPSTGSISQKPRPVAQQLDIVASGR